MSISLIVVEASLFSVHQNNLFYPT